MSWIFYLVSVAASFIIVAPGVIAIIEKFRGHNRRNNRNRRNNNRNRRNRNRRNNNRNRIPPPPPFDDSAADPVLFIEDPSDGCPYNINEWYEEAMKGRESMKALQKRYEELLQTHDEAVNYRDFWSVQMERAQEELSKTKDKLAQSEEHAGYLKDHCARLSSESYGPDSGSDRIRHLRQEVERLLQEVEFATDAHVETLADLDRLKRDHEIDINNWKIVAGWDCPR